MVAITKTIRNDNHGHETRNRKVNLFRTSAESSALNFSVASHPPIEEALVNTAKARGVPQTPPNTRSLRYCMPKKIGILFIGLKLRKFQIRRKSNII